MGDFFLDLYNNNYSFYQNYEAEYLCLRTF